MTRKLISYIRVSTAKQGASGLGLEAQQAAVESYRASNGCSLVAEYREVESGKKTDRTQLAKAMSHARRTGSTLVFAKLDRLARNARFLLGIVESGADVVFCDFPSIPPGAAGKFILTMMASVAELEAGLISERTTAALVAARARGVKLGGVRVGSHPLNATDRVQGGKVTGEKARLDAQDAYADLLPRINDLREWGSTLQEIADKLNEEGHTTRNGAAWNKVQVSRILKRSN